MKSVCTSSRSSHFRTSAAVNSGPLSDRMYAGGPYRRPLRQQNLCFSKQITFALRQAEAGTPVAEVCRKLQISETTFYRWKKRYGSLGTPEIRELRQLRDENRKLKQLVADLSLDKHILQESLKKDSEAEGAAARRGRPRDPEDGSTSEPAVGDGLHA